MLSFLYVYSDHSILECYNLFSGVELSMRSFFVIIIIIKYRTCAVFSRNKKYFLLFTEAALFCNLQVSSFSENLTFQNPCFAQILTELLISISALKLIMGGVQDVKCHKSIKIYIKVSWIIQI